MTMLKGRDFEGTLWVELTEAFDEINKLKKQVSDKHQLFMCASANYDRLAEHLVFANDQLSECEAKWNMTADALVMATGQIGELVELLDHALSYTCCTAHSPSLTQKINAALAKLGADKTAVLEKCRHQWVIDAEHPRHECCQKCGEVQDREIVCADKVGEGS